MQIFTPISNGSVHWESHPGGRVTASHTLAAQCRVKRALAGLPVPLGTGARGVAGDSLPLLLPEDKGEMEAKESPSRKAPTSLVPNTCSSSSRPGSESARLPDQEEDVFRTLTHSPFHLLKRTNLPVSSATSRNTVVCALWSAHKGVATTPVKDRGVKAHSHHQNETC